MKLVPDLVGLSLAPRTRYQISSFSFLATQATLKYPKSTVYHGRRIFLGGCVQWGFGRVVGSFLSKGRITCTVI